VFSDGLPAEICLTPPSALTGNKRRRKLLQPVIPANAGIQNWTPAFAGVTENFLHSARWDP
jgi:hypothetical protein